MLMYQGHISVYYNNTGSYIRLPMQSSIVPPSRFSRTKNHTNDTTDDAYHSLRRDKGSLLLHAGDYVRFRTPAMTLQQHKATAAEGWNYWEGRGYEICAITTSSQRQPVHGGLADNTHAGLAAIHQTPLAWRKK
jgi:hypothetical protein